MGVAYFLGGALGLLTIEAVGAWAAWTLYKLLVKRMLGQ